VYIFVHVIIHNYVISCISASRLTKFKTFLSVFDDVLQSLFNILTFADLVDPGLRKTWLVGTLIVVPVR